MKQTWWTIHDKRGRMVPGILFQNTSAAWKELGKRKRGRPTISAQYWLRLGYTVMAVEIEWKRNENRDT